MHALSVRALHVATAHFRAEPPPPDWGAPGAGMIVIEQLIEAVASTESVTCTV